MNRYFIVNPNLYISKDKYIVRLTEYNIDTHIFKGTKINWITNDEDGKIEDIRIEDIELVDNKLSIFKEINKRIFYKILLVLLKNSY